MSHLHFKHVLREQCPYCQTLLLMGLLTSRGEKVSGVRGLCFSCIPFLTFLLVFSHLKLFICVWCDVWGVCVLAQRKTYGSQFSFHVNFKDGVQLISLSTDPTDFDFWAISLGPDCSPLPKSQCYSIKTSKISFVFLKPCGVVSSLSYIFPVLSEL